MEIIVSMVGLAFSAGTFFRLGKHSEKIETLEGEVKQLKQRIRNVFTG